MNQTSEKKLEIPILVFLALLDVRHFQKSLAVKHLNKKYPKTRKHSSSFGWEEGW